MDSTEHAFDLVEDSGLGHLVSFGMHGFNASSLPFLVDRTSGRRGSLRGHFARANEQWKRIDGSDVLVLVALADGYVSPGWYPSKAEHEKVVPTWNYEVVHVHGTAHIYDDVDWVRQLVTDLTDHHEARKAALDGLPTWAVADAPPEFVDKQLRAIVGVEIEISVIEAKRKLSQNRSPKDQSGVIDGLEASQKISDQTLARAMQRP